MLFKRAAKRFVWFKGGARFLTAEWSCQHIIEIKFKLEWCFISNKCFHQGKLCSCFYQINYNIFNLIMNSVRKLHLLSVEFSLFFDADIAVTPHGDGARLSSYKTIIFRDGHALIAGNKHRRRPRAALLQANKKARHVFVLVRKMRRFLVVTSEFEIFRKRAPKVNGYISRCGDNFQIESTFFIFHIAGSLYSYELW